MKPIDTHECSILYVDDEPNNLKSFSAAFRRDFHVFTADSAQEGLEIINTNDIQVIVTDQRMPEMTGVQFLQNIPDEPENVRIILTGFSDMESIIDAINTGKVYRYITKPWDKNELKITLNNALETVMLRRDNKHLIKELQQYNQNLEEKVKLRTLKIEAQRKQLEEEMAKSEQLLLNILPKDVAEELRRHGRSFARKHENVSVLFADIVNFSAISERLSPEDLVNELDHIFRYFDNITNKYGLEKIKTIGDAYMCACGLGQPTPVQTINMVKAGLEMLRVNEERKNFEKNAGIELNMRIGINTGPVVAGVVGMKKFAYDIWGDTVNIAARMEQHGKKGRVNISGATYELVQDHFRCTHRGKIETKNKGELDMYFVDDSSSNT